MTTATAAFVMGIKKDDGQLQPKQRADRFFDSFNRSNGPYTSLSPSMGYNGGRRVLSLKYVSLSLTHTH